MGLGNALRKVWPSSLLSSDVPIQSSSHHRDSSPNSRRSRNRSTTTSSSTRRKRQPYPNRSSSHEISLTQRRRRPPPAHLTQQQAQERAVIASYKARLQKLQDRISLRWAQFEAEPDEYHVTLELRHLRADLQQTLESYYAALGARSNHGIESVLHTMEDTDTGLAKLDNQVLAEVSRFEQAAMEIAERFSSARLPEQTLNICADADETLIELELYRDSWGHIMDRETHARLLHATTVLREVVATCAPIAHRSPVANGLHPQLPNGGAYHPGYIGAPGIPHPVPPHLHGNPVAAASSFNTYAAVLRHQQQLGIQAAPVQNQYWNGLPNDHPPVANGSHTPPELPLQPTQYSSQSPAEERKDTQSSESGDEGAMQMVMSRTRTLRDMAASAMSQKDDFGVTVLTTPPGSYDNYGKRGRDVIGMNTKPFQDISKGTRSASRSASQFADTEQPTIEQTHQMSFASTLYHTRHERVDAISDAGVLFQRSNVRGDGRCLFRAVVRCRYDAKGLSIPGERIEREEADHLRERAVAELIRYRELLARFFVIEGNFAQYTKKMSHHRTYGGEPELLMLAKILHVPIAVYISKNRSYRQIQVYGKQYRGDPLRILYSDGIHYDALLARK